MRGRSKYRVAAPSERTARGRCYASKAERLYADYLYVLLHAGELIDVVEQPKRIWYDGVLTYTPDFHVDEKSGKSYYVDVKGHFTRDWPKIARAWLAVERLPLIVMRMGRSGRFETVETLDPAEPRSSAKETGDR